MLSFPNAKINLGLNIVAKRADGFHNIETVFYPIGLKDALEFVENGSKDKLNLTISGIYVDGNVENNLICKAYHLLRNDFTLPGLDIYLEKHIPLGAGLGGGSADAAFMLLMLNDYFDLNLSRQAMEQYAMQLGSDCPFFIQNKAVFASGKGELFDAVDISLKGYYTVLVKPDVHVNTALAYAGCKPNIPSISLKEIIQKPVEKWRDLMENDFEATVFQQYPTIAQIKLQLYKHGAIYASMSGSGSSVFALFKEEISLKNHFKDCFVWEGKLD